MHSTSLFIAAFAAVAAATPLGTGSGSSNNNWGSNTANPPYPTATGGYSMTTSYVGSGYTTQILGVPTASPNPVPSKGFVGKLLTEDTTVNRFKDIAAEIKNGDVSLKFDFNPAANPNVTAGYGGQVDLAQRGNFPILTGLGISAAGIFFQPCGLNTPHIHPRASEFFTLVTDNEVPMLTGFVLENGLTDEFNTTLTQFQGTVFPMGSIHFQQNLDCKPATAIAGLSSDEPGASSIAQNFIKFLDPAVVDAALGFPKQIDANNFQEFKDKIPLSLAKGVEECLIRCQIPY